MLIDPLVKYSWVAIATFEFIFWTLVTLSMRYKSVSSATAILVLTIVWYAFGLLTYLVGFANVS
jgi:hypothetical protein